MAGFEHGEKLVVLKKLEIGNTTFNPGDDFPYEDLVVDMSLVERLLEHRQIARAARVSRAMLAELATVKVKKIIKNYKDKRIAVSWPLDEDLPKGVEEGRPGMIDSLRADLKERIADKPEPEEKKSIRPRRRAKTTSKKD